MQEKLKEEQGTRQQREEQLEVTQQALADEQTAAAAAAEASAAALDVRTLKKHLNPLIPHRVALLFICSELIQSN